jgi:Putative adhesin
MPLSFDTDAGLVMAVAQYAYLDMLFLLIIGQQVFAGEIRERFEKTYPLKSGGEFRLKNTNGSAHITSWDRNEVKIEAEKIVRARRREDAERIMREINIDIRQSEGLVDVDTRLPKHHGGFLDWIFSGGGTSIEVTYWISVPVQVNLVAKSVNGEVRAQGISGRAKLETTNGGIEVINASGSVSAETTNGAIEVSLTKVTLGEAMRFETMNGRIKADFPSDFAADISAHTINGHIDCDFPMAVQGRIRRTSLEGRIGSASSSSLGRVTFRTMNGSIDIRKR